MKMNITMKIKYLSALPIIAVLVLSSASLTHAQSDVFTQNLYYGLQNNSQVTQLQEFLTSQNLYSGPITGNFYFLTLGAVKAFQTQQGITPAAGYFGPLTMAAANKIADAAVGASNNEAITETGTSTPPVVTASTTPQLQLAELIQEVALLQQQLQAQQSSTQALQQIVQNTTPVATAPTPTPTQPQSFSPAPTASITVNGSANAISIPYGTATTISWTSTNANSCNVTPTGWTGISSNQSTGNLTASQTYTLTCSGAGGSTSASITINVGAAPQPVQTTLTVTKDASSPTTNVVAGNYNQTLAKFDVLASGGSVTFNEIVFGINGGNAINNFRVVDNQGAGVGTTQNVPAGTTSVAEGSGSLNYVVPANTTRVLTVYGDLPSTASGTVQVIFNSGNNTSAQGTFATVWNMPANLLTVLPATAQFNAATNSGLGSPVSASANTTGVEIGSYTFTAGQVNPVNLSGISVLIANQPSAAYLSNLRVMNGSTPVGSTQPTVTANTTYNFNSSAPIAIAVNGSVTLDVYADIQPSAATTQTTALTTLQGVNASTMAGNSVSLASPVSGQTVSFTSQATSTTQ
jgi:hypothetical protein